MPSGADAAGAVEHQAFHLAVSLYQAPAARRPDPADHDDTVCALNLVLSAHDRSTRVRAGHGIAIAAEEVCSTMAPRASRIVAKMWQAFCNLYMLT